MNAHVVRLQKLWVGVSLVLVTAWARGAGAEADWRLTDENPNSPRHKAEVSPRDYTLQVSAYYFGSAE